MTTRAIRRWRAGALAALGLVVGGPAHADTIQLIAGQTVSGKVLTYSNMVFDIQLATGGLAHYQAADITRIVFGPSSTRAVLDTGEKDPPEVAVSRFESAAFTVESDDGQPRPVPAALVTSVSFGPAAVKSIETITHGQPVIIAKHLAPGKVTVVDFYADWCGPCRMISPYLEQLVAGDHDVVLRKVDVVSWNSPVAQEYGINAIPHIEVYDRAGKITGIVSGVDPTQVKAFVDQAKAAAAP